MKKWTISIAVLILSFAFTLLVGFYAAIFLIGPHSDILPQYLFIPVGFFLIFLIIGIPVWLFQVTLRHFKKKEKNNLSK